MLSDDAMRRLKLKGDMAKQARAEGSSSSFGLTAKQIRHKQAIAQSRARAEKLASQVVAHGGNKGQVVHNSATMCIASQVRGDFRQMYRMVQYDMRVLRKMSEDAAAVTERKVCQWFAKDGMQRVQQFCKAARLESFLEKSLVPVGDVDDVFEINNSFLRETGSNMAGAIKQNGNQSGLAASLLHDWECKTQTIMHAACEQLGESKKQTQKPCWRAGMCICGLDGAALRQIRSNLRTHLKHGTAKGQLAANY